MKTKIILVFLSIVLPTCTKSFCQIPNDKSDTLNLLLEKSRANNKNLFLVFGWAGCGWCRVFDKYHSDPQVKEILSKYFIITKVDIYKSKAGENLYKKYGKEGTPYWTIFNLQGQVVVDSDNGKGNVGYPATDDELAHYVRALQKTAPNLSKSESDILVAKLKEYRNKKEQVK